MQSGCFDKFYMQATNYLKSNSNQWARNSYDTVNYMTEALNSPTVTGEVTLIKNSHRRLKSDVVQKEPSMHMSNNTFKKSKKSSSVVGIELIR